MDVETRTGFGTPLFVTGSDSELVLNKILYNVVGYHSDDTYRQEIYSSPVRPQQQKK